MVLRALLDLKGDPQAMTRGGRTPLHHASSSNSLSACTMLIERGSFVNVRDIYSYTPLHLTVSLDVALYLVSSGARPDLKNSEDITAMTAAISNFTESNSESDTHKIMEARDQFKKKGEVMLMTDTKLAKDKEKDWVKDEQSKACLLCNDGFTLTHRRHHCRFCGLLVCGTCSAKKFCTQSNPKEKQRCCDACYNKISFHAKTQVKKRPPTEDEIKQQAELEKQQLDQSKRENQRRKMAEAAKRKQKIANMSQTLNANRAATKQNDQDRKDRKAAAAASATSEVTNSLHQSKAIAQNNIELLNEMEKKSEKMEDSAKGMQSKATQLKNRAKNKLI